MQLVLKAAGGPPHSNLWLQFEVKNFLQSVYGLDVVRVRTANHEGAKKRNKQGTFYRRPDWKKVYVTLKPQQAAGTTPQ